ncbi:hypothetical protein Lser_V15G45250 [Lactuca serriola]
MGGRFTFSSSVFSHISRFKYIHPNSRDFCLGPHKSKTNQSMGGRFTFVCRLPHHHRYTRYSKTLKEEQIEEPFESLKTDKTVGWLNKINLNEISHESAMGLVKRVLDMGYLLTEVYVDILGDPENL